MPEAPIHKNRDALAKKEDVGLATDLPKRAHVHLVSQAPAAKFTSEIEFRSCISSALPTHGEIRLAHFQHSQVAVAGVLTSAHGRLREELCE